MDMAGSSTKKLDSSASVKSCNATKCFCPFKENRNYRRETGLWEIVLCETCGSYGTHIVCSFLESTQIWSCRKCIDNDCLPENELSSQRMVASSVTNPNTSARTPENRTCSIEKCLCPYEESQKYQEAIGSWEILLCFTCGINGTHRLCSFVRCFQPWCCATCQAKLSGNH